MKPGQRLPKGLEVTLALTTPITQQDAVGALIGAKVVGNVHYKGKVIVPDGAQVYGRIRRLERDSGSSYFLVELEFIGIETGGAPLGFYADLQNIGRTPGIETKSLSKLPGVGTFFVAGPSFELPQGLKMVWKTSSPRSANP
jgi:hypothetical protein